MVNESLESNHKHPENKKLGKLKIISGWPKWKIVTALLLAAVMVAAVWIFGTNSPTSGPVSAGETSIVALEQDVAGISTGTAFRLSCQNALSKDAVIRYLKLSPAFAYDLERQEGGTKYKIIPRKKLAANRVYRLSFDPSGQEREDLSWAFQTRGAFRVISTMPQDQASGVPANSGIEFAMSHDTFNIDAAWDYFSISPRVKGRFEKHNKTLVFVPEKLKAGTIYKVTLKKGFPLAEVNDKMAETCRLQFETAAPVIGTPPTFDFNVDGTSTEFSSRQAPFFTVYYNADKPPKAHVDVYRYNDQAEYRAMLARRDRIPGWCSYAWSLYREDVKEMARVVSFDSPFNDVDEYNHYISFPESLKPGYYIAEIKAGDDIEQIIFQVSDLAVYLTQNEGSTVMWVNDLSSGKTAPGVTARIESRNMTLHGSASGVVLAEQNLIPAKRDYALVTSGGKEVLVPLDNFSSYSKDPLMPERYWKYLYLDRSLYQPGDTVNVWGVLTPRAKGSPEPKEVTLELWGEVGNYAGIEEVAPITSQKVKVTNHCYTGRIKLPRLKPGYYSMTVTYGTMPMSSYGFSVETYKKPAFKMNVESDRKALFVGQKANIKANASFFEGTPVPGLSLNYNDGRPGTVKTNQRGEALIPFVARNWDGIDPTYNYQYLNVSTTLPEVGEINKSLPIVVFKSQVYIKGEVKEKNNKYALKAQLKTVDLSRVDADGYAYEGNFLKDPVPHTLIKGELFKDVWTKVKTGQRYNYITKETEELYEYYYSTKRVNSFVMTTDKNGVGTYSGSLEPRTTYFVELSAVDKRGRLFKTRIYINHFDSSNRSDYYRLQDLRPNQKYVSGDKVTLSMLKNEQELDLGSTSILFLSGQSRIEKTQVEKNSSYSFVFSDQDIPNVNVRGIYFDGNTYQESDTLVVAFDGQSRALKVSVIPGKKVYRPGEKAKLTVKVTDKNGVPIKGARVNLNLVDEALYSMADQWVDLIRDLYQDYYYLNLLTWRSHYHPYPGGAEYGGEGGSERKVFSDTVLFTTLETGDDGQAKVEFKLPDNLTSWRVTYHAITDDLYAGSGTTLIPVRLPFFVEMSMNDAYAVGDTPVVSLRGYGANLKGGQPVAFKMQLTDPQGKKQIYTAKGDAFVPLDWKLPRLKEGSYSLTVWGSSGAYRDAISKPITVASSVMEKTGTTSYLLKDGLKVQGSAVEPTTLVFTDYDKSQALNGLYQLCWQGGCRLEQRLAGQQAVKLLRKYFPDEAKYFITAKPDPLLEYQRTDGGISILPYASSDPELTALVALCAPEEFDWRAFRGYFCRILDNTEDIDKSPALLGLATLNEPVLLKIQNQLKEPNLAPAVKINLALALVEIGDGAGAKTIYKEILKKYGQDLGTSMRINVGRKQDDILGATTRMALLAARLDSPEKSKLFQYLLENPGKEILNVLEMSQILKYNLQYMDSRPVSFTYQLQGKTVSKQLDKNESYKLVVPADDLKNLRFSHIKGRVGLLAQYTVPYSHVDKESEDRLAIKREYVVGKRATTYLKRSDLVQVVIYYAVGNRAPEGQYEIVDVLPAGLALVNRPYNYENQEIVLDRNWYYPVEVKGRKVSFLVNKGRGKITYYARVISPGTFSAEAPLLGHVVSNQIYTRGTPAVVTIR